MLSVNKFRVWIYKGSVNPLTTDVPQDIETSQLICNANQLTVFYMMGIIGS